MNPPDRVAVLLRASDRRGRELLSEAAHRHGFLRSARRVRGGLRIDGELRTLPISEVASPAALDRALREMRAGRRAILRWRGDRVIPLENALAAAGGGHRIAVIATRPEEVPSALGALEHGADLVVVEIGSIADLERLAAVVERAPSVELMWRSVRITRVAPAGASDRVLVDTTRLLGPGEGLLVGSSARFLFGVASEAAGSAFSRPRPFRVNAGAPHSYVLLADGTTRYLSELVAGDRVLVAGPRTVPSTARVGRLKIERRPMVLVEAALGATRPTIFLQEAETVRLMSTRGPRAVPELSPRDRVLGVGFPPGRHLGTVVEERVEER